MVNREMTVSSISAIRRINVENMVEPAELHTLNPVLLYRMVSTCLTEYTSIARGILPPEIHDLLENLDFVRDQLVRSDTTATPTG